MLRPLAALTVAFLTACTGGGPTPADHVDENQASLSPSARIATTEAMLEDLSSPRHESDGGGRAWLATGAPTTVTASSSATFPIVYEADGAGIAPGGMIVLMASPFWGWSGPQSDHERRSGYTTVTTDADGVVLTTEQLDQQLLAVVVGGRTLAAGEQVRLTYGAGPLGAVVDRFAESSSPIWLAVDGDGDGVRQVLSDSPRVDVTPGPATRLVVHLPSVARPGETVRISIALLDGVGNGWPAFTGTLHLSAEPAISDLATAISLDGQHRGHLELSFSAPVEGVVRISVTGPTGLSAQSNPMTISSTSKRIFWADLHGHSGLSDGTGTPGDYLAYARDIAALDIVALTDHDHWGVLFLDQHPQLWQQIKTATTQAHEPGRFVTLLGYEWTSWLHGHRHVLYFGNEGEVLSSIDERWDTPTKLWAGLEGQQALTFAHHSAGGPVATNWDFAPHPEFEPCTEVVSVHGSSEAPDSPAAIYSPIEGNFVRDVLKRGYRFGFVGSGDSHDGHPGLAHLGAPSGGVAAILSDELNRESVLEALQQRRVYATNGPRIVLRFAVNGHPMGSIVPASADGGAAVVVLIEATAPIERVDLITPDGVVFSAEGDGLLSGGLATELDGLGPGDWVYSRVVQSDGGAAWSSPVYFE